MKPKEFQEAEGDVAGRGWRLEEEAGEALLLKL
jgi:hypothetical protein